MTGVQTCALPIYYFGPAETQQIIEWNKKFNVKTAAEQFFLDFFEPATDENDGDWFTASAIFEHLRQRVGVSLLKPVNVSNFGRLLSNMTTLQKRSTKYGSEYLVKLKKSK